MNRHFRYMSGLFSEVCIFPDFFFTIMQLSIISVIVFDPTGTNIIYMISNAISILKK